MIKKIFYQILCLAALAGAILAVFWFNASSASRKTVTVEDDFDYVEDPDNQGGTVSPDTPVPDLPDHGTVDGDGSRPDGSLPDGSEASKPDPEKEAYDRYIASLYLSSTATEAGYTLPVYSYGADTVPVLSVKLSDYTDSLTPLLTNQYRIVYRYDKETGVFEGVYNTKKVPMLSLYGGLLLAYDQGKTEILSWIGEYACSALGYYPIYQKDSENRALFQKDGLYYYYDEENGGFVLTEKPDFYGIYFDSVPGYGNPNAALTPFYDYEAGKWGYKNRDGEIVIPAQYLRAYPFGDNGIAAVQSKKLDGLLFIDEKGKVILDSHLKYYKYEGANAFNWYRAPELLDENAIGCLYFDHGYMRVTLETYALINSAERLKQEQALVDVDGNVLHLPTDYKLVSYSNGIAVLEKDGRYGYYSYTGRWITDPLYSEASPFVGGLGTAKDTNGKYHVFDTEGNEVIPGVFDYVSSLSMGKLLCYKENEGWMLLTLYAKQPPAEDTENGEEKEETEDTEDTEDTKEDDTLS